MAGAVHTGLNYAAIPAVLLELRVPYPKRAGLIADLRVMEAAALPILNAREPADDDGR